MPVPPPPEDNLAQQADYWLALSHSPFFGAEQKQALQDWLSASLQNQQAWRQAQLFWQQTESLTQAQIAEIEKRVLKPSVLQPIPSIPKAKIRYKSPVFYATAACLVLAITLKLLWQPGLFADYQTAKGEQEQVVLRDGSSVLLNTDTRLSVKFSQNSRALTLHEGEAYFTVAPDKQRPFTVQTAKGDITALGTAFNIQQLDDDLTVTVFQHAVRVKFSNGQQIEHLNEGQQTAYIDDQIQPTTTANLNQAKAWREHRLVFKNQPLQTVVAELERYRPVKIIIANKALAQHRVTGVFDPRDTEAAITVIEKTLGLKEYRLTNKLVVLLSAG